LRADVVRAIATATTIPFELPTLVAVAGGSISQAFCLHGRSAGKAVSYFIKYNHSSLLDMFAAEAEGLRELASAGAVRIPHPVCYGISGARAFLVTEYIDLYTRAASQARLGEQLASLHRCSSDRFGWHRDNSIGSSVQINMQCDSWIDFFRDQRLGVQLSLARGHGAAATLLEKGERLQSDLPLFFSGYSPRPSLLHGDLWGGNMGFDGAGEPVLFDPAVYYGDRETDIAMTELFGGFDADFYAAYRHAWPLDDGYERRKGLYNLYHLLNHANLFGGSYAGQAESMMDYLLADIGTGGGNGLL